MKRSIIACLLIFTWVGVIAREKQQQDSPRHNHENIYLTPPDSHPDNSDSGARNGSRARHSKLIMAKDTLTLSDYMMSIDRVNDALNSIRDSSGLGYKVEGMHRRIDEITRDVSIIWKNVRGRGTTFSVKNLNLYQNFATDLNRENDRIEARVAKMYNRLYNAKLGMRTVLSDSVFRILYGDDSLHNAFDRRLYRLERKYSRSDSTIRANIDTLNIMKMKIADNAVSLSNMINILDARLDKTDRQLFGKEVNYLWQKTAKDTSSAGPSRVVIAKLVSENKAIGYYTGGTAKNRIIVFILAMLFFIWLFSKRKLLNAIKNPGNQAAFLNLQYLNNYPVISILAALLCLMPLFDAYAPTSYIATEYFILLVLVSFILYNKEDLSFFINWLILCLLFIAYTLTYLFVEPKLLPRLWLLGLQGSIAAFSFIFLRSLDKGRPYYRRIKIAAFTAIILSGFGILCNLMGRFSLSGILGISAIFAVTQVIVLPVFAETITEIILLQLQSSRMRKGFSNPFDSSLIANKIKIPLDIIAIILWFIMLTSNLNIYNIMAGFVTQFMTATRSIGSISFKLISVLLFFAIIWFAHVLQRLISFLFGETGIEAEDNSSISKKQHSRLLITRLLVLTGGYLTAIAATGLPLDKITILLGALGIGIGMGLQNVVNNFVSGIILIFDGSLQIGDEIEVSGQAGKVKEIGLRASTLTTADGAEVIIPNGTMLSQNIVNWTFTNDQKRVMIWFMLSGKELDANVINDVINETVKNIPDVVSQKKPVILYTRVTGDTCTLNVRFWSTIKNADRAKSEAILQLSKAFADKNIQFA